jgi:hypothetical protein
MRGIKSKLLRTIAAEDPATETRRATAELGCAGGWRHGPDPTLTGGPQRTCRKPIPSISALARERHHRA